MPNSSSLSKLKLSDLKSMCKRQGLHISGRKSELIRRILNNAEIASKTSTLDSARLRACLGPDVFKEFDVDKENLVLLG
jgi:hypothetical protein